MAQVNSIVSYSVHINDNFRVYMDEEFTNFDNFVFQIHLKEGNYRMADQSLEVGLSYNFQVGFVS